ncbi:MAG: transporter substrate-binding domain-containing protein [Chloroflexi bacterium]|nr:transporter substrate-binding domain-containing protein [Chloroflexota bacterium]
MNLRKTILLVVSAMFLVTACQSAAVAPASTATQSTLDKVRAAGVVRAGVRFDNPPLSYIDPNGNWVGFDVDLANELARRLNVKIEQVKVDETTRISFLQEGKIDMAVASMNHTRKREDAVDFSLTYFWDSQTFMVRQDSGIDSLEDLFGKKVALNAGSSAIDAWKKYVAEHGGPATEIVEFTDKVAAVQALRDGAVDGYAEDGITLLALAAGDANLVLLPGGINPVQFGIGLPVNDSAWRDAVNYALQEMWKDGTYAAIYDKWLGPEAEVHLPLGGQMEVWP